jgi:hypothetical protein
LGPKEKENGKLARILGKKAKRKKNTTYNSVATTQASKEGRKEGTIPYCETDHRFPSGTMYLDN